MSSSALWKAFTRTLKDTVQIISERFPTDNEVVSASHQIRTLLNTNSAMVVRVFHQEVQPYKEALYRKDLDFFLALKDDALGSLHLENRLSAFSKEEQGMLWDKFITLFELSDKIIGK